MLTKLVTATKFFKDKKFKISLLILCGLVSACSTTPLNDVNIRADKTVITNAATTAAAQAYEGQYAIFQPVKATKGMVVTEQQLATEIGQQVLAAGGNAVDAAVAVGFSLAVVLPNAGNLGGGGFMLVHDAKSGQQYALDFRETAPQAAFKDMYLDSKQEIIPGQSLHSHKAVAVPGTVDGLLQAHAKWGSLSLPQLLKPAINLAQTGFTVSYDLAAKLQANARYMAKWPATRAIFWRANKPLQQGDLLVQTDLARTLTLIAQHGRAGFYTGPVAQKIATEMARHNGLINLHDLSAYQAKLRKPILGEYRGYKIATMPPPSSGGIHLVQMLNILENFDLSQWGANSADYMQHAIEAMRFAYADRSEYLGDADFVPVPAQALLAKTYAKQLAAKIQPQQAGNSSQVKPGLEIVEGTNTTHYSIADRYGNAVAVTYTLNTNFGSGIVAAGTGVLLNNEMDDFSAKPGVANVYGLIGGKANAIAAGKRPLSSMTPTIVLKQNRPWLITGSPGGSQIITTVLETIIDMVDFKMNPAQAAASPRFHHQWWPDEVRIEQGFSPDTLNLLKAYGYRVKLKPTMGKTQTIVIDNGYFYGAADPRNPDSKALGIN